MNHPCFHFNTMTHGVWAIGVVVGSVLTKYGSTWGVLTAIVGWLSLRYFASHWWDRHRIEEKKS